MTDVSLARIQYCYRCPFDGCPNTVLPPRLRCAVHTMLDDWNHFITDVLIFEASRRWVYSRLRRTRFREERN
jgi:hypothetical protein